MIPTMRNKARIGALWLVVAMSLPIELGVAAQKGLIPEPLDDALRIYAVHINGANGMYLGNGLVITAAHVAGNVADTRPRVIANGSDVPSRLVKQGSLEDVDLTLLSVDPFALPIRMRMRHLPLCDASPYPGESVVVVTPESTARSHVLSPTTVPSDFRARFGTVIGDAATTGNSGSGVLDARRACLLGIISRKITAQYMDAVSLSVVRTDVIAKYFVPVKSIRDFIPPQVSF